MLNAFKFLRLQRKNNGAKENCYFDFNTIRGDSVLLKLYNGARRLKQNLLQYQQGIDIIFYGFIIWAAKKEVAYRYLLYLEHS